MTEKIIQGTYADFKIVKTRNVAQFIIEIPIERAQDAINMFGVPTPNMEQWVAIAALNSKAIVRNEDAVQAVKLAGMLCNSREFGVFLRDAVGLSEVDPLKPDSIADGLRAILGIHSRTEFHDNEEARTAFNRVKGEYDQWLMTR